MKRILLLTLLCAPVFSFSQNASLNPTTAEQYMYVTRGYIDVLTKGLDAKRGYHVINIINGVNNPGVFNQHKVDIKALISDETNRMCATMIIVYTNNVITKILCLPNQGSDSTLFQQYVADESSLTEFEKSVVILQLSYAYNYLTTLYEQKALAK